MAVRVMGGYDSATGWPPDDSTDLPFQDDVDIPGKFQGGGKGFGLGGFHRAPKIVAPATGAPPGTSISGLPEGGAGGFNPFSMLGAIPNPYWKGAIAGAGVMAPTPAETGELTPAQLAHGPSDPADLLPQQPGQPSGGALPFQQPDHPSTMRFPMWPTPPAPAPQNATGGIGSDANFPIFGGGSSDARGEYYKPGQQPATTGYPGGRGGPGGGRHAGGGHRGGGGRAAAPAAAAPAAGSPWITAARPNRDMAGGARGQGQTQMGMLDLSKLFGRR